MFAGDQDGVGVQLEELSYPIDNARKSYPKKISDCRGTPLIFGPRLAIANELVDGEVDVLRYLPQQNGGNVSVRMEGYCCGTPVGVAKLFVRSSLPDRFKARLDQYRSYFFRLENRDASHDYATTTFWVPTNSVSSRGSPSSSNNAMTSLRLSFNSSRVSP